MSNVLEPGGTTPPPEETVANRFTPDAQERMAQLRAMAAQFPDEEDPKPLTKSERRIARETSVAALERAAVFAEAAPRVGDGVIDVTEVREAIAFELAYTGVRDEARAMARRVEMAILRRKLKVARPVRTLYRLAKGYATLDDGDPLLPHVADMKRALIRPRRSRKDAPAAAPASPTEPDPKAARS